MPTRAFISDSLIGQVIPVAMLGVPALILAVLGICFFVRPSVFPLRPAILSLLFTMIIGLAALLLFQKIALYSLEMKSQYYGKATAFVFVSKFIGWAYQSTHSDNVLQRFLGCIFGVGLCEEMTKLFPLLWFVFVKKAQKMDFRGFLIVAFFSGMGFGIGEAIGCYSPWSLLRPPNLLVSSNTIRWFACVPSHAIYTVIDAAFLWVLIPRIKATKDKTDAAMLCSVAVLVIALVHGIYDVLCDIPGIGILLDAASVFLMYFVVVWAAKKTYQTGVVQENDGVISMGVVGWLKNHKAGQIRFGRIYMISSAMIIGSLVFSSAVDRSSAGYDASITEDRISPKTTQEDYGMQYRAANRRAVHECDVALEIAERVGGNSGTGNLEILVAAVANADWSACGPDLRSAALSVKNIRNGDSRTKTTENIQRFIELCGLYR